MVAEEVRPSAGALRLLPKSNPECTHDWRLSPTSHMFYCSKCPYELSYLELFLPKEGGEWRTCSTARKDESSAK